MAIGAMTRPKRHCSLSTSSSTTRTRSPRRRFRCMLGHLLRSMRWGTYSRLQWHQNWSSRNWLSLHLRRSDMSRWTNSPGETFTLARPCRKWFGVRALTSDGDVLLPPYASGRELRRDSTSVTTVRKVSSTVNTFPSITFIARLVDLIRDFHAPPNHGAAVGLKLHWTPRAPSSSWMCSWSNSARASRSSSSAPTKLVPLSLRIRTGFPWRALKRRDAMMHESVLRPWVTLRWTARMCRHVKRQPYRFSTLLRPTRTRNGPAQCNRYPTCQNGVLTGSTLLICLFQMFFGQERNSYNKNRIECYFCEKNENSCDENEFFQQE